MTVAMIEEEDNQKSKIPPAIDEMQSNSRTNKGGRFASSKSFGPGVKAVIEVNRTSDLRQSSLDNN